MKQSLRLPDTGPADATMQFHAGAVLILDKGASMPKYDAIDPAAVATRRRADINAGRPLAPRLKCHYCDNTIAKGELWCSTGCATDYTAERKAVNQAAG